MATKEFLVLLLLWASSFVGLVMVAHYAIFSRQQQKRTDSKVTEILRRLRKRR